MNFQWLIDFFVWGGENTFLFILVLVGACAVLILTFLPLSALSVKFFKQQNKNKTPTNPKIDVLAFQVLTLMFWILITLNFVVSSIFAKHAGTEEQGHFLLKILPTILYITASGSLVTLPYLRRKAARQLEKEAA